MAQDAGSQQIAGDDDGQPQDRRDTRRSAWPFIVLAIVILIVLLLLWLYWRPLLSSTQSSTQADFVAVVVPPAPANPNVPAPSTLASESTTGSVVPNVVGDPETSARRALEGAGFVVSASRRYDASKPPGIVFAQTPSPGTLLDPGSVVAIAVSTGSAATGNVTMPNVIGMTQSQASAKVQSAGLVPYVTYGNSPTKAGRVISQWPLGGQSTPRGGQGLIQIGINP